MKSLDNGTLTFFMGKTHNGTSVIEFFFVDYEMLLQFSEGLKIKNVQNVQLFMYLKLTV